MKRFFQPDSVAIIGASDRDGSLGLHLVRNLLFGYAGALYPVNQNYSQIQSVPCYPSVESIPGPVDLAIIIIPAPAVPGALEACARKGIGRVIIQSAGFSEVGPAGAAFQEQCVSIARAANMRIWGPNCMGIVDIPGKQFFTFMSPAVYEDGLIPGRISLIVQSGMLSAGFLADLMSERHIGVGKACSIGNKSDVDECDVLEYLLEDGETDGVGLYLESFSRGRRFIELVERSDKPVVLLKGGRSEAGARAALSHTSSLAGNARLQESLLEGLGVTIARDFQQMIELTRGLAMIPETPARCRTAIITFSGGAGILSCDLLEEHGLRIAEFSPETMKRLKQVFPDWMPVSNPVDLFPAFGVRGPLQAYRDAFDAIVEDPAVDTIFMHFIVGFYGQFGNLAEMKEAAERQGKSLVLWVIGRREGTRLVRQESEKNGIPAHGEVSRAVECLAAASRYEPRSKRFLKAGPA